MWRAHPRPPAVPRRRARLSEVGFSSPGLAGPDSLPIPIPLSPSALGITSLQVRVASTSEAAEGGSPVAHHDSQPLPQVDWQLGALPAGAAAAPGGGDGGGARGRETGGGGGGGGNLYCLLGKLYCEARAELLRLGAAAGLDLPKAVAVAGRAAPQQPAAAAAALSPRAAAAAAPAPAPEQQAAQQAAGADVGDLSAAPSATDLAQVDLGGPSAGGSQKRQAEAGEQGSTVELRAALSMRGLVAEGEGAAAAAPGSAGVTPRQVAPAAVATRGKPGGEAGAQAGRVLWCGGMRPCRSLCLQLPACVKLGPSVLGTHAPHPDPSLPPACSRHSWIQPPQHQHPAVLPAAHVQRRAERRRACRGACNCRSAAAVAAGTE